jgi:hypothetical protein
VAVGVASVAPSTLALSSVFGEHPITTAAMVSTHPNKKRFNMGLSPER